MLKESRMRTRNSGNSTRQIVMATACGLLLAACVNTASTVSTEFYSVKGSTSQQLDRELRTKGPLDGHALASAAIRFEPVSVFQKETAQGCSYNTAKFRVDANITLPRWANKNQSNDRELRRAWNGLARYAKLHEQTHVKIAETYAKALGEALMDLPPQSSCEKLDRESKKVVDKVSRNHDRAQKAFDAAEQKRLAALFAEG